MRSFIVASALAGLALAAPAPIPQDIDFDLVDAAPEIVYSTTGLADATATAQTITYDASAILESAIPQITSSVAADATTELVATNTGGAKVKRAACASQATGYGPVATPDTATAFLADSRMSDAATGATAPSGYTQQFVNQQGSNNAYGYLGYTTLKTYDVAGCAAKCDKINGCMSINIYFERDPSQDPSSDDTCSNPPSTTNIKCVFWGGPVSSDNANNKGQWRSKFQVVIAGSNGYTNNTLVPPPGYNQAVPLGANAINAPLDKYGFDTYMGSAIFTDGPFNASLCADACTMKSQYNVAHPPKDGPVQTCQFFNTYIMYINNTKNLQGQYCAMYSESWSSSYATNNGQYRGNDHYMMQYSYAFSNSTDKGVATPENAVYQAVKDIKWASYQPFCSSYLGYTVPSTTVSTTTTISPVTTSTTFTTTTITTPSNNKRALTATVDGSVVVLETLPAPSVLATMDIPGNNTAAVMEKRAPVTVAAQATPLSTPNVLTKYSATILSSACSLQATPATVTSTITNIATTSLETSTIVSTVVSTETVTPAPKPSNVVVNGDFSTGNLDPWGLVKYSVDATVSNVDGKAVFQYPGVAPGQAHYALIQQPIPGDVGTQYHVTADVSVDFGSSANNVQNCIFRVHTSAGIIWSGYPRSSSTLHVDVSGTFTSKPTYLYLRTNCDGYTSMAVGPKVAWDNVVLTEVS